MPDACAFCHSTQGTYDDEGGITRCLTCFAPAPKAKPKKAKAKGQKVKAPKGK